MSDGTTQYSLESDTDYLVKLRELVAAQTIRIRFDAKKLRQLDSPVVVVAETERWAFVMAGAVIVVGWFVNIYAAAGALAVAIGLYLLFGRRAIARNLERRIHEQALKDVTIWRALWQFGGVSLEAAADANNACAAPKGRWIAFVEQMITREAR